MVYNEEQKLLTEVYNHFKDCTFGMRIEQNLQ